jgi:hypothetical protein
VLAAQDLTCWTQALLLTGGLARAEPKTLRYRLLHVAARIVRHARRVILRLQVCWPWLPSWPVRSPACGPYRCAAKTPGSIRPCQPGASPGLLGVPLAPATPGRATAYDVLATPEAANPARRTTAST